MSLHHGIIHENVLYTTKALARIVLEKEEYITEKGGASRLKAVDTETINKHLKELKCKAAPVGNTTYVVGKHFIEAVEASASLVWLGETN